jgi:hypothetical protein
MAQDAVNDPRISNERDDAQAGATDAYQRFGFENSPNQTRPGAAGFPGEVGIVPVVVGACAGIRFLPLHTRFSLSAPVRVRAIKALTMASAMRPVLGSAAATWLSVAMQEQAGVGRQGQGMASWYLRAAVFGPPQKSNCHG